MFLKQGEGFPWKLGILNEGVMERSYLRHLLLQASWDPDDPLHEFAQHLTVCTEFGLATLRRGASRRTTNEVEAALRRLRVEPRKTRHTFIVGAGNHFSVITIIKRVLRGSEAFAVYFCDSMNKDFLCSSEEAKKALIAFPIPRSLCRHV